MDREILTKKLSILLSSIVFALFFNNRIWNLCDGYLVSEEFSRKIDKNKIDRFHRGLQLSNEVFFLMTNSWRNRNKKLMRSPVT